jgi:hypothetical protein
MIYFAVIGEENDDLADDVPGDEEAFAVETGVCVGAETAVGG